MVIGIRPDKSAEYKRLHAEVWPTVLSTISECDIRNYTIFLREPECLLFSYWEYHGRSFADDSARMASNPATREWWALCGPCQRPLDTRGQGEWWAPMEAVFHLD